MLDSLWTPTTLGRISLPHRLVMAPMTRDRSTPEGVPTELNAEYYAQRASHALIITEGTQPSPDGQGYLLTPGIHDDDQIAGWRKVTDAVHEADGRIFIQLMHTGRIAYPDNTPHGRQPVAPSEVRPEGVMFTASGPQQMPTPRALSTHEVVETVDGSIEGRIRFVVEVAAAVAGEIGAERTGIRISPGNRYNDIAESDTAVLYPALLNALRPQDLAYLHVMHAGDEELLDTLRALWPSTLILNRGGADLPVRAKDIDNGTADLVSVGALSLANPDLVERLRAGAPLNTPDPATFYGGGVAGYTDYPTHTG
jgi:N-ethylmaleimide reductase